MTYKYFVKVKNVDNRLIVTVNGTDIYDKFLESDPLLDDIIEITNYLQPTMINKVRFRGFNSTYHIPGGKDNENYYHFCYQIVRVTYDNVGHVVQNSQVDIMPPVDKQEISKPNLWVLDNEYPIVKEGNFFIHKSESK